MLCSFLIHHLQSLGGVDFGMVLFYMFDRLQKDKQTPLSAACSLIFQLLNGPADAAQSLFEELSHYKEMQSGQEKADDFEFLWSALSRHIQKLPRYTIVVDAMDECENSMELLDAITKFLKTSKAKVVILSRREQDLTNVLESYLQIEFGNVENHADISSFLESKISKDRILSSATVNKKVCKRYGVGLIELLLGRSKGCFMWATSALKEIERRATASEIVLALKGLPSGLTELYRAILQDYNSRMRQNERRLCCMILRWLVCAAKPLSSEELWAAVRSEYLQALPRKETSDTSDQGLIGDPDDDYDHDSDNGSDDDFFFSPSQIETMCGSLVSVTDGTVHLAHLSIAQFLGLRPSNVVEDDELQGFFVDVPSANVHLTTICIGDLDRSLGDPPIQPEDRGRQVQSNDTVPGRPFLNYSVRHWPFHLVQCGNSNLDPAREGLKKFMLGPKMLYWLERWFAIEDITLWDLQQQLSNIVLWRRGRGEVGSSEDSFSALICRWSQGISQLLKRHGASLEEEPSEIHFLDPRSYDGIREEDSVFSDFITPDPPVHTPHFRLDSETLPCATNTVYDASFYNKLEFPRRDHPRLALFNVDKQRNVVFTASFHTVSPTLRCHDIQNSRDLQPMPLICKDKENREFECEGYSISASGKFLALLYFSSVMQDRSRVNHRYDINVWELAGHPHFENNEKKTWCKLIKSASYESPHIGTSPRPLVFDSQDNLYCPWGPVGNGELGRSEHINGASLPASIGRTSMPEHLAVLKSICFSLDRRFIVAIDPHKSCLVRYLMDDLSLHSMVSITFEQPKICCVSKSGRYVVWRAMDDGQHSCYLQDFVKDRCNRIPLSEEIRLPAHMNLAFTLNEEYLVGSVGNDANPDHQYVAVWGSLAGIIQQARSKAVPRILGLHITEFNEPAYLALSDRWIEFHLSHLELLSDQLEYMVHHQPYTVSRVSEQGDRLALLSLTETGYVEW